MVATEMMQRYKKLQFERGESQHVTDSSLVCGQWLSIADTRVPSCPGTLHFTVTYKKDDDNPILHVLLYRCFLCVESVVYPQWIFLLLKYTAGYLWKANGKEQSFLFYLFFYFVAEQILILQRKIVSFGSM